MRILFTTVALPGHFFPLVPLAWACRVLGHSVLVAAPDDFADSVVRAGLPVVSYGPGVDVLQLAKGEHTANLARRRHSLAGVFGRVARRALPGIQSIVDSWRPDLVVSERAEFAGPVATASAGVALAELHWGMSALSEYRAAATAELQDELSRRGRTALPEPAMALNPWPPSLRRPYAAGHQNMRSLTYNGTANVPAWVWAPRDRPRVCLTLGTVLPWLSAAGRAEAVLPLLRAVAELGVELVVAMDDRVAARWPALPDAVRHAGRLPLSQVLPTCDVAIHHGGQGTSLTALETGRPQLVLPQFDDQFDNAEAVARTGAGIVLLPEENAPRAVAERCTELLDEPGFGRAAARTADEIAAQPSPMDLVALLEAAVDRIGPAAAAA